MTERQLNLYRVSRDANRDDTIEALMSDVRAADSYRDTPSGLLDARIVIEALEPGEGVLIWLSEEVGE